MKTRELFRDLAPDYSADNDPWGHAMGAFFAVADELTARGLECPAAWQWRPSPFGQDTDSYEYETLQDIKPSDAELQRLGAFLHRLTGRIDRAGRSY